MAEDPRIAIARPTAHLPTVMVNRFTVQGWPDKVRISVGDETVPGEPNYHFAFIMSATDARQLGDMIDAQLLQAETNASVKA